MKEKKNFMTSKERQALQDELDDLRINRRKEIAEKIKEAREQGDLSENAEYDAALNAQAENEARILKLKHDIEHAEVYDSSRAVRGVIDIGSVIKVFDEDYKEECTWRIVGSNEADVVEGKISDQSPVGRALIGHRAGDVVTGVVEASGYNFTYRIISVGRD